MQNGWRGGLIPAMIALMAVAATAQKKQEFHITVSPGSTITVINAFGPVTVHQSSNNQLLVTATPHSNKVEVDQTQNANRVEVRTHVLQKGTPAEERVDYDVQVPANVSLRIQSVDGPLSVDGFNGDLSSEGESAHVEVRNGGNGHVHVRTVEGPVVLTNLKNAHMEVTSVSGDIALTNVTGPSVVINTTKSKVKYDGDFANGGDYAIATHSGDIEITMPADASVDMSARSVSGSVQDAFQLQPEKHPVFTAVAGKSFAGVANSGQSEVKLRSFSGKITVKKK